MRRRSGRVLMVDDEQDLLMLSGRILEREGHAVQTTTRARDALTMLAEEEFDVVLLDLRMPDMDGLAFLKRYSQEPDRAEVVVLTAYGSIDTAVAAMKLGAYAYVSKPFNADEVLAEIDRILEVRHLRQQNQALRTARGRIGGLIGQDEAIQRVRQMIKEVASTPMPILIRGETGTGKELIAQAIHHSSDRAGGPLVVCNCATFAAGLLESELFGHVKGAFTGATSDRKGRFEEADTGTLFLDEVGDLSLEVQIRLLRVLQEQTFERVGSTQVHQVDVRILSATHKVLEREIAEGRFREDLFYRINGITIEVPPLRARKGDLPVLCAHLLERWNAAMGKQITGLTAAATRALKLHDWPGNVRELENVLARAVALCGGREIDVADLGLSTGSSRMSADKPGGSMYDVRAPQFNAARQEFEKQFIERALRQTDGNISQAADLIQIGRRQLQRKIKDLGIEVK